MSIPKKSKGEPPQKRGTRNLDKDVSDQEIYMGFKVPESFKLEFKMFATQRRLSQKDLLIKAFNFYKENHG